MKKLIILIVLGISTICFGQKSIEFADSIRTTFNIPEISYAVISGDSILEIATVGKHSLNLPDLASLEDRFHIGSNTKAMTAFIIAKYVEKGKLKWTTKFFDLFPEWKLKSKPEYFNITLQDLLSHRAGIQPFQGEEEDPKIPIFKGTKKQKRKQFSQFLLTLKPVFPDEQNPFVYSNAGYTLAALMVEKVSGKSWEQLVKKTFNKDLKLNVKFSWPENQHHKDTWGHLYENEKLIPVPSNTDLTIDYTEPAGDLNIKLKDYVKFIQLNLQGLQGKDNYLNSKTYNFIHKGIENYSLGWYNIYENNNEFSTHSGTDGTYYTLAQIDRTKNIAFIIFTNSFNNNTIQGVRLLMRELKKNNSAEKL